MIRRLMVLSLGLFALAVAPADARAWTKFKNTSPNAVWTAHAFSSLHISGWCGWNDQCSGSGKATWRVQGWWLVQPGATVQVHNLGFGNALHQAYGEDDFGNTWSGGGHSYSCSNAAFNHCGDLGTATGGVADPMYTFFIVNTSACCGGFSCSTDNATVTFAP